MKVVKKEEIIPKVSVIIPAFDEEDNVPPLVEKFCQVVRGNELPYEVILVDDGSSDRTYERGLEY